MTVITTPVPAATCTVVLPDLTPRRTWPRETAGHLLALAILAAGALALAAYAIAGAP